MFLPIVPSEFMAAMRMLEGIKGILKKIWLMQYFSARSANSLDVQQGKDESNGGTTIRAAKYFEDVWQIFDKFQF